MSGKSETHSKDMTTAAHPEGDGCCGETSAAEPTTKASNPADPAAIERPNPSVAVVPRQASTPPTPSAEASAN